MSVAPHVILRQCLHLCLPAAAAPEGTHLHQRAEHTLLGPPLLAALDEALSGGVADAGHPPGAWLTLDSLTLDLGMLSSDGLEAQLLDRLPGLLRQAVAAAVAGWMPPGGGPAEPSGLPAGWMPPGGGAAEAGGSLAGWGPPGGGPAGAAGFLAASRLATPAHQLPGEAGYAEATRTPGLLPASVVAADAWLFFLRWGSLPAYWPLPSTFLHWEAALRELLRAPTAALVAGLRAVLAGPVAAQRLVRQFSPSLCAAVIATLWPQAAPHRARLGRQLATLLGTSTTGYPDATGETICLALLARAAGPGLPTGWPAALASLAAAKATSQPAGSAAALLQALRLLAAAPGSATPVAASLRPGHQAPATLPDGPEELAWLTRLLSGPPATAHAQAPAPGAVAPADTATSAWAAEVLRQVAVKQAAIEVMGAAQPASGQAMPPVAPGLATAAGQAAQLGLSSFGPATAPAEEATYVANAGVVLLHPFLPACFAACGWLGADEQFHSPEAQAQAVLLVHYLATGRGQAPEYALQLPRLLCGVLPAAPPPPRRLALSRAARSEGRALLRAALSHWAALRNTTPAGLRTAFLQREGKLELGLPGGPALTVAQQAQDILLGRLPYGWGLSIVQLPWLPARLTINWA